MATAVPASLKSADISRFALRAAQLEKFKPAIAYWCNYWILNQILAKNLHNADAEALTYTTGLMDKVEQFKSANAQNDAVVDDVAGKAYVEQFGLETFGKADHAVRTDKVTVATADVFLAAVTFLELLAIWGPLDQEISSKIKYAKYHALRIRKAVRSGEDPNLSNPKSAPEPEDVLPQLDPNDAEVKALEGSAPNPRRASVVEVPDEADKVQARLAKTSSLDESLHPSRDTSQSRPPRPSVAEVPDEADRIQSTLAQMSSKDESLHPSRVPSRPSSTGNISPLAPQDVLQDAASFYTSNAPDISPIEGSSERKPSIGGNYFPVVPFPDVSFSNPSDQPPNGSSSQLLDTGLDLPSAPSESNLPQVPHAFGPSSTKTADGLDSRMQQQPGLPSAQSQIPPNVRSAFVPGPQSPMNTNMNMQGQPQYQSSAPAPTQPAMSPYGPPSSHPQLPQQPQQPQQRTTGYQPQYTQPMPQPQPQPVLQQQQQQQQLPSANVVVDEEAVLKAQKHARWAISALNFEDVPTAIRELQGALAVLGAR